MKMTSLINKQYEKKDLPVLLEQYKIITESADKITERRQTTNNYYFGINSFLLSASSYLAITKLSLLNIVVPIIGTGLAIIWLKNINSFKQLNSAKFKVIHELETYLPANIYKKEDEYLRKEYYKLTAVEKWVPKVFIILYALLLLFIVIYNRTF